MKNLLLSLSRSSILSGSLSQGSITDVQKMVEGVTKLMKSILGPILTVVGLAAVFYAIYLGIMYAKAEDANKRKEVQGRLIGACIGAVIIVVGATLCFALNWGSLIQNFSGVNIDGYTPSV